jgi:tripeptide aminopeptidase
MGNIEAECFYGYSASVEFSGTVIHPGSARGRLANALTMAGMFISMLPRNESPEATDGRYGFYCPLELKADMEFAKLDILLRDFDLAQIERRAEFLQSLADTVKKAFPGGEAKLSIKKSYSNMKQYIDENPEGLAILEEAVRKSGLEPSLKLIRGGTDGSRLSEMGIPCPNVFTGGYNYHSRKEWAALPAMARAAMTVVNLALLWAEKKA